MQPDRERVTVIRVHPVAYREASFEICTSVLRFPAGAFSIYKIRAQLFPFFFSKHVGHSFNVIDPLSKQLLIVVETCKIDL